MTITMPKSKVVEVLNQLALLAELERAKRGDPLDTILGGLATVYAADIERGDDNELTILVVEDETARTQH